MLDSSHFVACGPLLRRPTGWATYSAHHFDSFPSAGAPVGIEKPGRKVRYAGRHSVALVMNDYGSHSQTSCLTYGATHYILGAYGQDAYEPASQRCDE